MEIFPFYHFNLSQNFVPINYLNEFGGGWVYGSRANHAHLREFDLHFETMRYYITDGVVDNTAELPTNLGALEQFWRRHAENKVFLFPHPAEGLTQVRFAKPLELSKFRVGSPWCASFTVCLTEVHQIPPYTLYPEVIRFDGGFY